MDHSYLNEKQKQYSLPLSAYVLLGSNVVTIFLAVIEKWDIATVLWVYWWQSVIIGFSAFFKMLLTHTEQESLVQVQTKSMYADSVYTKVNAFFFVVHYGIFHAIYAIFLTHFFGTGQGVALPYVSFGIFIFLCNHAFSFYFNFIRKERQESKTTQALQKMLYKPYKRIIPMHIILIAAGQIFRSLGHYSLALLAFFLVIKMICDVFFHLQEHGFFRKRNFTN